MRYIQKTGTGGGYSLAQAHTKPPQTPDGARTRWGHFDGKQDVRDSLLKEQYQLCCYTEIRADQLGLGYHIEHVENKSQNPQRTFDYSNLAASALDSGNDLGKFKRQRWEVFGGHAAGKQSSCDMTRFISCHQTDCARFFAYLSDGRVVPVIHLNAVERDQAEYTINLLNLNSPYLVTKRQEWWAELDQLHLEHEIKNWCLLCLAGVDLIPGNNMLSPFFSITRQFFGSIAEAVLKEHASDLL